MFKYGLNKARYMSKKRYFSDRDNLLLPLFILSLLIISILIGKFFSTIVITFFSIVIVSAIASIFVIKKFDRKFVLEIKKISYILSFSLLITLIFAIVLPYLLFQNSFLNIYVIQYIYVLPLLFVFIASLHIFDYLLNKKPIRYQHLIVVSLVISVIISLVLSIVVIIGTNNLYNERTEIYKEGADFSELEEQTVGKYHAGLVIFDEIKANRDNLVTSATDQWTSFAEIDSNKGLCIQTNCARIIVDKSYHLITYVVHSAVIDGTLDKANEELEFLNTEGYTQNFTSLEEYETFLRSAIDSSGYTLSDVSEQDVLDIIESDFNYAQYRELLEGNFPYSASLGFTDTLSEAGFKFKTNSLLAKSLARTVEHSVPFQELFRLLVKTHIFVSQQGENSDLFVQIYNNIDVEESTQSKIIRYRLILSEIEWKI